MVADGEGGGGIKALYDLSSLERRVGGGGGLVEGECGWEHFEWEGTDEEPSVDEYISEMIIISYPVTNKPNVMKIISKLLKLKKYCIFRNVCLFEVCF